MTEIPWSNDAPTRRRFEPRLIEVCLWTRNLRVGVIMQVVGMLVDDRVNIVISRIDARGCPTIPVDPVVHTPEANSLNIHQTVSFYRFRTEITARRCGACYKVLD